MIALMSNTEYHFKTKAYNASCKLNPMKKQVITAGLMYEANISNHKGWQPLRVTLVMGDHSQNAKVGDISDLPTFASHTNLSSKSGIGSIRVCFFPRFKNKGNWVGVNL